MLVSKKIWLIVLGFCGIYAHVALCDIELLYKDQRACDVHRMLCIDENKVADYAASFKLEKQITSIVRWAAIVSGISCAVYIWFKPQEFTRDEIRELRKIAATHVDVAHKQDEKKTCNAASATLYEHVKNACKNNFTKLTAFAFEQGKNLGTMLMQQFILGAALSKLNSFVGFVDFSRESLTMFLTQRTKIAPVLHDVKMCLDKQELALLKVEVERLKNEIERILGYMAMIQQQIDENDILANKHCSYQVSRLKSAADALVVKLYSLETVPQDRVHTLVADLDRLDRLIKDICYSFAAAVE